MEVILTKQNSNAVTYGEKYVIEQIKLENVTRIDYVYGSGLTPHYDITHKSGDDIAPHTTSYGSNDYLINIMPMIG